MNRLNKIILSFVLPFFCLLISVSHAEFTGTPMNNGYGGDVYSSSPPFTYAGYSCDSIKGVCANFISDKTNSAYKEAFDTLVSTLSNSGYGLSLFTGTTSGGINKNYVAVYPLSVDDIGLCLKAGNTYLSIDLTNGDYTKDQFVLINLSYSGYSYFAENLSLIGKNFLNLFIEGYTFVDINTEYSSKSIKQMDFNNTGWWWTGVYYYEALPSEDPNTPSLPSNQEIASAVQAFYNSDYYKNNKDFEDFFVLYNTTTGYFSFVGHNQGIDLGQVIVPADYTYDGITYSKPWWKFFLRNIISQVNANLFNKYYWLYGTADFGENFEYQGKGAINDLLDVHFATASVIVYSTSDYPVVKIETNEETGALEPVEGTIPGDQYTYDENVDPTTNEYNPLENFVPTSPSQSILGDVDFNEINKVFEENKDILNIENASWLFSANNQLVSYFLGFLLLLIVFLIISRVLGG